MIKPGITKKEKKDNKIEDVSMQNDDCIDFVVHRTIGSGVHF